MNEDLQQQAAKRLEEYKERRKLAEEEGLPPPAWERPPLPARMVVVEQVYYQPGEVGESPFDKGHRFDTHLLTDEQVWERQAKVGKEWQMIDLGWLKDGCSQLIIRNLDRVGTLEVGGPERETNWYVPPNQDMRGKPCQTAAMMIRSDRDNTKFLIIAFPK